MIVQSYVSEAYERRIMDAIKGDQSTIGFERRGHGIMAHHSSQLSTPGRTDGEASDLPIRFRRLIQFNSLLGKQKTPPR